MNVQPWLALLSQKKTISQPVLCLTSTVYPLLFCSKLISYIQKNFNQPIVQLHLADHELDQLKAQLEMEFLGQQVLYWLHSFDDLPNKKRDEWFSYLHTYKGPHQIVFFSQIVPHTISSSWETVQIPEHADKLLCITILSWFNNNARYGLEFIEKLYQFEAHIPIDTAVLLVRYAVLSGANQEQFFTELLHKIIEPSNSLFSLSQAFFGKSKQQFFRKWSQVSDYYVPSFGLVFGRNN